MTNPSPPPAAEPQPAEQPDQHPRPSRNEVLDLGRLRRSNHERRIAGVAAGLARHLDIDPIIVRVTLVVLVFFGGAGLLLYGAAWLLVPEEGSPSQPLGLDDRNRGIALLGTGILAALAAVGDWAGAFWFPWPLVILALVIVWFLNRKDRAPELYYPPVPGQPASGTSAYGPSPYARSTYDPPAGAPSTDPSVTPYAPQPGWQTETMRAGSGSYPYRPDEQQAYARPRNPRKRGPILFWFTLALIATGVGTLGIVDVSGTAVPDPAYPALALALSGAMLLLGAFWGRAGGLILIGLLAALGTLVATAASNYEGEDLVYSPTTSAEVRDVYRLDAGELVLDLSAIEDVDGLDGQEIVIDGGVGEIEVIVPDGTDVTAAATVGVGDVSLFREHNGGVDIGGESSLDGGPDVPAMRITIDHGVGQVTVREQ